jgi:hypothetical protein
VMVEATQQGRKMPAIENADLSVSF